MYNLNVTFSKDEVHYSEPNVAVISIIRAKGDQGAAFVDQMEESVRSKQPIGKEAEIKINKIDAKKLSINDDDQGNVTYIFLKHEDKNYFVVPKIVNKSI